MENMKNNKNIFLNILPIFFIKYFNAILTNDKQTIYYQYITDVKKL